MYRQAKPVDWCQCCTRGVSFTNLEGSSNLLGNHDSSQIVHSSDNAGCLHISFSFSCRERPMCRSCFVLQCGTAHRPFPTIILQITMLLFVKGEILYLDICFLFCVQIITKGADTPSHLQWRITDSDQLLILLYPLLSLKSRF